MHVGNRYLILMIILLLSFGPPLPLCRWRLAMLRLPLDVFVHGRDGPSTLVTGPLVRGVNFGVYFVVHAAEGLVPTPVGEDDTDPPMPTHLGDEFVQQHVRWYIAVVVEQVRGKPLVGDQDGMVAGWMMMDGRLVVKDFVSTGTVAKMKLWRQSILLLVPTLGFETILEEDRSGQPSGPLGPVLVLAGSPTPRTRYIAHVIDAVLLQRRKCAH